MKVRTRGFLLVVLLSLASFDSLTTIIRNSKLIRCKPRFCGDVPVEDKFEAPKPPNLNESLLLLNAVAVIWGTQHVIIKSGVESFPSTSVLNFWRFAVSTAVFFPSILSALQSKSIPTLRAGAELGLYTFLGFAFQAIGLETTTASRSAFLLYLNVKFVPFLAAIFLSRQISSTTWASAFMALSGTFLLSTDGGPMNTGDLWCIAAALSSALFILRLEVFAPNVKAAELNGVSCAFVAALCGLWVTGDIISGNLDIAALSVASPSFLSSPVLELPAIDGVGPTPIGSALAPATAAAAAVWTAFASNPWPVVYLGGITTALCNYLQTVGQRAVPAERAAIIYSLDPVYGAFFSWFLLGERLGPQGWLGAALILFGVWLTAQSQVDNHQAQPSADNLQREAME